MATFVGQNLLAVLNMALIKLGAGWSVSQSEATPNKAQLTLTNPDTSLTVLDIVSEEYGRKSVKERLVVRGFIGGILSDSRVDLDPNCKPSTLANMVQEFLPVLEVERQTSEIANVQRSELLNTLADRGAVFGEDGIGVQGTLVQISPEGGLSLRIPSLTLDQLLNVLDVLK